MDLFLEFLYRSLQHPCRMETIRGSSSSDWWGRRISTEQLGPNSHQSWRSQPIVGPLGFFFASGDYPTDTWSSSTLYDTARSKLVFLFLYMFLPYVCCKVLICCCNLGYCTSLGCEAGDIQLAIFKPGHLRGSVLCHQELDMTNQFQSGEANTRRCTPTTTSVPFPCRVPTFLLCESKMLFLTPWPLGLDCMAELEAASVFSCLPLQSRPELFACPCSMQFITTNSSNKFDWPKNRTGKT